MRRIILGTHDPQNFVRDIGRGHIVMATCTREGISLAYPRPHQNVDLIQTQVTGVLVSVSDIGEKFKRVSVTVPIREIRGGGPR